MHSEDVVDFGFDLATVVAEVPLVGIVIEQIEVKCTLNLHELFLKIRETSLL
jgi:hypothetical protein